MSNVSFIKDIYQSAVEHQSREIEKAIINQSSLTSTLLLKYGEIRHVTRNRYNAFVRDLNLDDIKVKKVINSSFWEVDEASFSPALNFLSMKLSEHLPSIWQADIIERKALDLLNNPVAT